MKFKLEINMDNAAFGESDGLSNEELRRIISRHINQLCCVERLRDEVTIRDSNGNTVGTATITEE